MKNRNIPFGYRYEDGKIVVNPDEQNTLQRICSEYLDGRSLLQIANGLESDKVDECYMHLEADGYVGDLY